MWIAPELVNAALPPVRHCSQSAALSRPDIVFETLDPGEIDEELPRHLANAAREVVNFEWHPATGELSFSTHARTNVFSDLAPSSSIFAASAPNCGSR